MSFQPQTVIQTLSIDDERWDIQVPNHVFSFFRRSTDKIKGLAITKGNDGSFSVLLKSQPIPKNRALDASRCHLYLNLSVEALRFEGPDRKPSDTGEYLAKIIKKGIRINGSTYWFFGHSNSNLGSRSCILMNATSMEEVGRVVSAMGNFNSIKPAGKCKYTLSFLPINPTKLTIGYFSDAKRVGLLFSTQDAGLPLAPEMTRDVGDVMSKDGKTEMSDGCGLISFEFSRQLAQKLDVHFLGKIYVPSIFQLRYLGYKASTDGISR